MKIPIEAGLGAARQFSEIIDTAKLAKRGIALANDLSRNPYLGKHFRAKFELEFQIIELLTRPVNELQQKLPVTRGQQRALEFIYVFMLVLRSLERPKRKALIKRLSGYLSQEQGLAPLEFELMSGIHLINDGFEIRYTDELSERCDWIATKEGVEFEVECKHASAESGRRIQFKPFSEICKLISDKSRNYTAQQQTAYHIRLFPEDRLPTDPKLQAQLAKAIFDDNTSKELRGKTATVTWVRKELDIPDSLNSGPEEIGTWLLGIAKAAQNREDPFACMNVPKNGRAVVIDAKSESPDLGIRYLYDHLDDAAKRQFTRRRPGILLSRLGGMEDEFLLELYKADQNSVTQIRRIASEILEKRKHLHSISFLGLGTHRLSQQAGEKTLTTIASLGGESYIFRNEQCIFAESLGISLFSTSNKTAQDIF